jgi:DNA polymerase sigma
LNVPYYFMYYPLIASLVLLIDYFIEKNRTRRSFGQNTKKATLNFCLIYSFINLVVEIIVIIFSISFVNMLFCVAIPGFIVACILFIPALFKDIKERKVSKN